LFRFKTFVQASAPWTARKQSGRSIFKFKRANHAPQPIAQSATFATAAIPLTYYPEQKNRRKKNQQIDRDQGREADPNHGALFPGVGEEDETMSLPHSTVAMPQVKSAGAEAPGAEGKRQSIR
jgi:hypothetical protein